VFDLDGVLIDSNQLKRDAFFLVFAGSGVPMPLVEQVIAAEPEGDRYSIIGEILRRHRPGRPDTQDAAPYVDRYTSLVDDKVAACPEKESATAVLAELSVIYPLYVNSATPEPSLRVIVERRGWAAFFRRVLGRPSTKVENLGRILAEMRTPAESVVFVGDQRGDAAAALACGCRFLGIENGHGSLRGTGANVLNSLPDLVTMLRKRDDDV
jgi:phosphoglycolate phosphatase-like HAD superfamily hydrolase